VINPQPKLTGQQESETGRYGQVLASYGIDSGCIVLSALSLLIVEIGPSYEPHGQNGLSNPRVGNVS
jgi:hypothetical protein